MEDGPLLFASWRAKLLAVKEGAGPGAADQLPFPTPEDMRKLRKRLAAISRRLHDVVTTTRSLALMRQAEGLVYGGGAILEREFAAQGEEEEQSPVSGAISVFLATIQRCPEVLTEAVLRDEGGNGGKIAQIVVHDLLHSYSHRNAATFCAQVVVIAIVSRFPCFVFRNIPDSRPSSFSPHHYRPQGQRPRHCCR